MRIAADEGELVRNLGKVRARLGEVDARQRRVDRRKNAADVLGCIRLRIKRLVVRHASHHVEEDDGIGRGRQRGRIGDFSAARTGGQHRGRDGKRADAERIAASEEVRPHSWEALMSKSE